jgi:TorA maturation chaperone TorD
MPLQTQKEFFNAHIAPWASHCFSDLEKAENALLYAPVGSLGRLVVEIEQESFRIEWAGRQKSVKAQQGDVHE